MPASFSEYGISKDLFETTKAEISAAALKDGTTVANPRKPSVADVTDILNRSFM